MSDQNNRSVRLTRKLTAKVGVEKQIEILCLSVSGQHFAHRVGKRFARVFSGKYAGIRRK